jgi:hypothetical protein
VEGRILEGKAWHDHPASALPGCGASPELADHLEADASSTSACTAA